MEKIQNLIKEPTKKIILTVDELRVLLFYIEGRFQKKDYKIIGEVVDKLKRIRDESCY